MNYTCMLFFRRVSSFNTLKTDTREMAGGGGGGGERGGGAVISPCSFADSKKNL